MTRFRKLLLIGTSVTITLFLVEVGFRLFAYRNETKTLEEIDWTRNLPEAGERVAFSGIIQMSGNPRIVYRLKPNLAVVFRDQPITTNANRFRGDPVQIAKGSRSTRIVGIGDSVMFGWGVKDNETYLSVLSRMLRSRYPETFWEVINTGVPGYNTTMEVETLKEEGLAYSPAIVIIDFVGNDLQLPNFISKKENYFASDQLFMLEFFRRTLGWGTLIKVPLLSPRTEFESDPRKVPKEYEDMVGLDAYYVAMRELKALSRKHNFEVAVLSQVDLPDFVKEIGRELGFYLVETTPMWEKYAEEQNLDTKAIWPLSKEDPHPPALVHSIIALALFRCLEDEGLIRRWQ